MLSALIQTELRYPAMLLAEQPVHKRFVLSGPLVLGKGLLSIRRPQQIGDRTVSRRSEPSSRTALIGEQPNPWELVLFSPITRSVRLYHHHSSDCHQSCVRCEPSDRTPYLHSGIVPISSISSCEEGISRYGRNFLGSSARNFSVSILSEHSVLLMYLPSEQQR